MSKLFNTINALFESDAPVTLTERGHKYIKDIPDDEVENRDRSWAKTQVDDRGYKFSKGDTSDITSERYLYDVIKHLAPTGYHFKIKKNYGHNNSRDIYLIKDGTDNEGFTLATAMFGIDKDDKPVVKVEKNDYYGNENAMKSIFNRSVTLRDVAQEVAREKGVKVDDDFMVDNGAEIRKRFEDKKSQNTGTAEDLIAKIEKQFNKLPSGGIMRQMESIEINFSEEALNEDHSDSEKNYFNLGDKYIAIDDGYGEECPYLHGGLESGERSDIADRFDLSDNELWSTGWTATVQNAGEEKFNSFDEIELYCYDQEKGNEYDLPEIPEEVKARFLEMVNQYVENPSVFENANLNEAWSASAPNWLKKAMIKSKKHWYAPTFTSETEFEKIEDLNNLKNQAKKADDNGQILFVRIGDTVFWFNDRRWRSVTNREYVLSNDDIMDTINRGGNIAAVITTNYKNAIDTAAQTKSDRSEAKKGSVDRVPKEDRYYYDTYDKSGYLINPNKYKDMLRTIKQNELASSSVIDDLEKADYVKRFNELGKQAAEFIGKNLSIEYSDDRYGDGIKMDTSVIDNVKKAATTAGNNIRKLMRRIDYVKGDKEALGYRDDAPETTNVEGWIKEQSGVVEQSLQDFEAMLNKAEETIE